MSCCYYMLSQDIPRLYGSPRLMCPLYPGISLDILGCQPFSTLHSSSPRLMYVSFISWDVSHSPHYSQVPGLCMCPLYPGISLDILGCQSFSTAKSQAYVCGLYILGYPKGCQPFSTLQLNWRFICPFSPWISYDISHPSHYSGVLGLSVLSVLGYPRTSWDVSHSPHYSWIAGLFVLLVPGYPRTSWDVSHPSHYSGIPDLSILSVPGYPRTSWDFSYPSHTAELQA